MKMPFCLESLYYSSPKSVYILLIYNNINRFLIIQGFIKKIFIIFLILIPITTIAQLDTTNNAFLTIPYIFYQRLESTCKYQETVLPIGINSIQRYVSIRNKRYLLEYIVNDQTNQRRLRENFFLEIINGNISQVIKAKYLLDGTTSSVNPVGNVALFTNYRDDSFLETGKLVIQPGFNLTALLLAQEAPNEEKWQYITDFRNTTYGDTVACYHFYRSVTDDTCVLELQELKTNTKRRWRGNNICMQKWEINMIERQVIAIQKGGNGIYKWVRNYQKDANFSETLVASSISGMGAGVIDNNLIYIRNSKKLSKNKTLDTFIVMNPLNHKSAFKFNIVSISN